MQPSQEELRRLREAAGQLRVGVASLRRWCLSGRVPFHRVGPRLIMLRQADIDELIRNGRGRVA